MSAPWSADLAHDPIQEKLRDMIAEKRKEQKRGVSKPEADSARPTGEVVNIMDALRKSLKSETPSRKSR
jgi:DNA end-binding protein Ku